MVFNHITLGQRVLFGTGMAAEHVTQEIQQHGARRVMVITSARDVSTGKNLVADQRVSVRWTQVAQHVPADLAARARWAAQEAQADLLVALGGGSAIGLGKAIALTTRLPLIAVPTTYAGSEATDMWGLTENGVKTTGTAAQVLPIAVVYDSTLSTTLPVELSVSSGINALAHCVDSLWAPRADPINQAMALEGARALGTALPQIVLDPLGQQAREQALYGCYLAAVAFASAGSGLHHKICHTLGGAFNLPHAQTHAVVLPHVLAFNAPGAPVASGRLAATLGAVPPHDDDAPATAVTALTHLLHQVDAPTALADLGLTGTDIPEAVQRVVSAAPSSNPVPVTESGVRRLLEAALTGRHPVL
ncbi:MAG: maleylacetate reductase [Kocuria sp.]|nr:maleylacetate reductase [Kocuria sp.]MDO5619007.1 maleylacetate reductase [Kocuria sp.]